MSEKSEQLKKAFFDFVQEKLSEIELEIRKADAEINEATEKAKGSGHAAIEEFKAKRAELGAKLEELKKSSTGALEEVKGGFEKSWHELKESLGAARDKFKKA